MIQAFVFCFERPDTLRACVESLFQSDTLPTSITFIDDCSRDQRVSQIIHDCLVRHQGKTEMQFIQKTEHKGFSDSAVTAMAMIREKKPDYVYFIESDYVYVPKAFDIIQAIFNHTLQGRECLGIVGYDHWNYRDQYYQRAIFPNWMVNQFGRDSVNRGILHKPFPITAGNFNRNIEFVSNTCFSTYLNWKNILKVEAEFPEFTDLLNQACSPRRNAPGKAHWPEREKYIREKVVDDGMLSGAISHYWNEYASKHGMDRQNLGAWLNITPGIAEHRSAGGLH